MMKYKVGFIELVIKIGSGKYFAVVAHTIES